MKGQFLYIILLLGLSCSGETDPSQTFDGSLHETLEDIVKNKNLVGISAAIILKDGTLIAGAAGQSSVAISLEPDMIFASGSISKTFTAVMILRLAQSHQLDLDDPISKWLPNYENIDPQITIRNLLNHTSGIYNYTESPIIDELIADGTRNWSPEEILSFVEPPLFQKDEGWSYSNSNYTLLGLIIEAVTRDSAHEFLRQTITESISLENTFFPPHDNLPDATLAHPWMEDSSGQLADASGEPRNSFYTGAWVAGAIHSSSADIAKFGRSIFNGTLVDSNSLAEMKEFIPINSQVFPHVGGYGLGLMQFLTIREYWGHSGDFFGYGSMFIHVPQDEIDIAFHVNQTLDENVRVDISTQLIDLAIKHQAE